MKYNFKNVAFFATAILTIGAFSACSNEIENIDEPQKETKTITFTATLGEDDPLSRTSYETQEDGSLKVSWKVGDKLYVGLAKKYDGTIEKYPNYAPINNSGWGYQTATVETVSNNGKTATFKMNIDPSWTDGQELNVFFGKPSNLQNTTGKEYIQIYCSNHDYNNGDQTYLSNYDFMYARTTYNATSSTLSDFSLNHCNAIIRFNLSGITDDAINSFSMTSKKTNDSGTPENVNYFFKYRTIDNNGAFGTNSQGNNLSFNTNTNQVNITKSEGKFSFYFSLYPTTYKDYYIELKVTTTAGNTYIGYLYDMQALEAGKVYTTPEITMTKQ